MPPKASIASRLGHRAAIPSQDIVVDPTSPFVTAELASSRLRVSPSKIQITARLGRGAPAPTPLAFVERTPLDPLSSLVVNELTPSGPPTAAIHPTKTPAKRGRSRRVDIPSLHAALDLPVQAAPGVAAPLVNNTALVPPTEPAQGPPVRSAGPAHGNPVPNAADAPTQMSEQFETFFPVINPLGYGTHTEYVESAAFFKENTFGLLSNAIIGLESVHAVYSRSYLLNAMARHFPQDDNHALTRRVMRQITLGAALVYGWDKVWVPFIVDVMVEQFPLIRRYHDKILAYYQSSFPANVTSRPVAEQRQIATDVSIPPADLQPAPKRVRFTQRDASAQPVQTAPASLARLFDPAPSQHPPSMSLEEAKSTLKHFDSVTITVDDDDEKIAEARAVLAAADPATTTTNISDDEDDIVFVSESGPRPDVIYRKTLFTTLQHVANEFSKGQNIRHSLSDDQIEKLCSQRRNLLSRSINNATMFPTLNTYFGSGGHEISSINSILEGFSSAVMFWAVGNNLTVPVLFDTGSSPSGLDPWFSATKAPAAHAVRAAVANPTHFPKTVIAYTTALRHLQRKKDLLFSSAEHGPWLHDDMDDFIDAVSNIAALNPHIDIENLLSAFEGYRLSRSSSYLLKATPDNLITHCKGFFASFPKPLHWPLSSKSFDDLPENLRRARAPQVPKTFAAPAKPSAPYRPIAASNNPKPSKARPPFQLDGVPLAISSMYTQHNGANVTICYNFNINVCSNTDCRFKHWCFHCFSKRKTLVAHNLLDCTHAKVADASREAYKTAPF